MKELIVVIDMQEGFRSLEVDDILVNIMSLEKKFPNNIVFSMFKNDRGSFLEKHLHWSKFEYESEVKLLREFRKKDRVFIFHNNYTVFNDELKKFIKVNKVKKVFLCGVYTDVCIIKAAMDIFDSKIEVFVIKDCCNSLHGKNSHNSALYSLEKILGGDNIISLKDINKYIKN